MPGGLMNLISQGQQSIILNGNPSKTFFKAKYAKYTNFGMQKFRVDFDGSKTLRLTEDSVFTFKIPRYADLLMDCYLSVELPNIWSPIYPPQTSSADGPTIWSPYEFKWIENIGAQMIKQITITCGNQKLQEFSGSYLLSIVQRDFSQDKKDLFDKMVGNITELVDPANANSRYGNYPNAFYTTNQSGAEPSIRGRTLYIPLNAWFNLKTQMAFPLIALQYNELNITVTFRPISELFRIRDVFDQTNNFPYVSPNFNTFYMQFYRFLQQPPDVDIGVNSYTDKRTLWNADIHLNCTYAFLSNDEAKIFSSNEQQYLFKQVRENTFYNITGSRKIELDTIGMVTSWLFYLQRSDVNLRNEWSNYSNWPYNNVLPQNIMAAPSSGYYSIQDPANPSNTLILGPGLNPNGVSTGITITGNYTTENQKEILTSLAILFDGQYRENIQPVGVYNYIEKYVRTAGNAPDGLYCYNFALNTSPFDLQPSGAINTNRFNLVELEITTTIPVLDPNAQSLTICDPQTGEIVAINKPTWRIYEYNFDMTVMEERINVAVFVGGNCALAYAT